MIDFSILCIPDTYIYLFKRYRCYLLAQTANKDYETKVKSNNIPITKLSLISCYLENAND